MLSREDSRRLAELERQLRHDDPEFCARMSGGLPDQRPRHRAPLSLIFTAAVIWLAALALGVLGWWPAAALTALCATIVVAAAVYRLRRRTAESANSGKSDGTPGAAPRPWGSDGSTPETGQERGGGSTPGFGQERGGSTPGFGQERGGGSTPGIGNEWDGGTAPGATNL